MINYDDYEGMTPGPWEWEGDDLLNKGARIAVLSIEFDGIIVRNEDARAIASLPDLLASHKEQAKEIENLAHDVGLYIDLSDQYAVTIQEQAETIERLRRELQEIIIMAAEEIDAMKIESAFPDIEALEAIRDTANQALNKE